MDCMNLIPFLGVLLSVPEVEREEEKVGSVRTKERARKRKKKRRKKGKR